MYISSTLSNSKSLKLLSDFYPRQSIYWFCRGLFCAVFRSFLERSEKLCQTKLMNNEQNRRSKSDFPSKSLVDSINSITFAPTRTRQASQRCSNVRVVLFLYDEQQNPIPETIRPMLPNRMTGSWITLPTDALRIYFDLCIIKYFLNIISMTPMTAG